MKQFKVTREAMGIPFHVWLGDAEQTTKLMVEYLNFCKQPRTNSEIDEQLGLVTACPKNLLGALNRTLFSRCASGRDGKLVDSNFMSKPKGEPFRYHTQPLGLEWLRNQGAL